MFRVFRGISPALTAALVLLFVACNGGDGTPAPEQNGSATPSGENGESGDTPLAVLRSSAEAFLTEVESLESEMELSATGASVDAASTYQLAYQAPEQAHITTESAGASEPPTGGLGLEGSVSVVVIGEDLYMNVPLLGWAPTSFGDGLGDAGASGTSSNPYVDIAIAHSFVDYAKLATSAAEPAEDLGEETMDGSMYRHLRGTVAFEEMVQGLYDPTQAVLDSTLRTATGPLEFDVWLDPDTLLPRQLTLGGELSQGENTFVFDASATFSGYNQPVEIPDPTEGSPPMFGPSGDS